MAKLVATWTKVIEAEVLQRSSQIISVVDKAAYIFGGELRPREPRDNDVHILSLEGAPSLTTQQSTPQSPSPSPRVGTASTTLNNKIYLFSGRGGVAMSPIEETGSVWTYDPTTKTWSLLQPTIPTQPHPAARSYHCTTSDTKDTIYLHAGCPVQGRLSDLWAFSVSRQEWTELAPAPDPPRGGASIAFADGKVYRMNGFDGNTEQGGCLDVYTPETNAWESIVYKPDGVEGPTARSVAALLPVTVGGRGYLVTLFGERDPSSLGHQGAGKMLGDVWAFDLESKRWSQVETRGKAVPASRGWFDADVQGQGTIIVQGGLGESNDRLGDVWSLQF